MTREEATQELVEWIKQMEDHGVPPYSAKYKALDTAIKALQAERHGEWQITEVEGGKIYVCSECSEAIYKSTFEENVHYYCNNCGAYMRGDKK